MDIFQEIRNKIDREELDYLFLLECLKHYKQPRDKITKLLKSQFLIRVKKGFYVFGKPYRKRPYSLEVLSNLIYGPSYVSFETALSFHGLIPESVKSTTAASLSKNKLFETPVGDFVYHKVPQKVFSLGLNLLSIDQNTFYRIAGKEKALSDCIARLKPFDNTKDLNEYLIESMRIELSQLTQINQSILAEINNEYQNINVELLWKIAQR
ncbi:MAG: hypothetical protein S4CHLAM7_13450 [Chlamydiae bacterium]|nr:hypothetical protein [Chlamydiota bacterium]